MSLRSFHLVFLVACAAALAYGAAWSAGANPAGLRSTPMLAAFLGGLALLAPYLGWIRRKRLPR